MDELIRRRFKVHSETGLLMHQRGASLSNTHSNHRLREQPIRENNLYADGNNYNDINVIHETKLPRRLTRVGQSRAELLGTSHRQLERRGETDENYDDEDDDDKDSENSNRINSALQLERPLLSSSRRSLVGKKPIESNGESDEDDEDDGENESALGDDALKTNEIGINNKVPNKRSSTSAEVAFATNEIQNNAMNKLTVLDEPDTNTGPQQQNKPNPTNRSHRPNQLVDKPQAELGSILHHHRGSSLTPITIRETNLSGASFLSSDDKQDNRERNVGNFSSNSADFILSKQMPLSSATQKAASFEAATVNQSQQHLIFLASSSIIFFLIMLSLYNWFFRRRTRSSSKDCTASAKGSKRGERLLSLIKTSFLLPKSLHFKRPSNFTRSNHNDQSDIIGGLIEGTGESKNFATACAGEHLQLIERKPATQARGVNDRDRPNQTDKNITNYDEDQIIQVVESLPNSSPISGKRDDSGKKRQEINYKFGNNMVILKRKLAKSSLVVTAKRSTKPRVKIISNRIKKFIDDEAQEIQLKRLKLENDEKEPWTQRAFAYILNALKSPNPNIGVESEQENQSIKNDGSQRQEEKAVEVVVEHKAPSLNGNSDEFVSASLNSAPILCGESLEAEIHQSGLTTSDIFDNCGDKQILQDDSKLSPSNLNLFNLDGCSSLSGCSLFLSPSPIESQPTSAQQNLHQQIRQAELEGALLNNTAGNPCSCLYNLDTFKNAFLAPHNDTLINHKHLCGPDAGFDQFCDYLRTRSQGQMPCDEGTGFKNLNSELLGSSRPCCSVSPSALGQHNSFQSGVEEQLGAPQAIPCCNSASPSYQRHGQLLAERKQSPLVADLAHRTVIQAQASAQVAPALARFSPHLTVGHKPINGPSGGKFCNIKRQYENYYDDEQEDAYRRLTDSIGMEFGLGFHHHHHHHHAPATLSRSNIVDEVDLMQFSGDGARFNFGLSQTSSIDQNQRQAHRTLTSHQQAFAAQHQTCNCCQRPSTLGSYENASSPANGCFQENLAATQQKRQAVCTDQHNPYPFKSSAASVGALHCSPNTTSLVGSDSGFVSSTPNNGNNIYPSSLCHNPLCLCQFNSTQPQALDLSAPAPPMSILVQQPSLATPPPPTLMDSSCQQSAELEKLPLTNNQEYKETVREASERSRDEEGSVAVGEGLNQLDVSAPLGNESHSNIDGDQSATPVRATSFSGAVVRPRWRYQTRPANSRSSASGEVESLSFQNNNLCFTSRTTPRRMSIAGDQVSSFSPNALGLRQIKSLYQQSIREGQQQDSEQSACLKHRASIATADGTWRQQQQQQQQQQVQYPPEAVRGMAFSHHHSLRLHHHHHQSLGPQLHQYQCQRQLPNAPMSATTSHRPSDASLYEGQYFNVNGGKSAYSSSTSSGIGVSGSTCTTNTPTSVNPNGLSFAAALAAKPLESILHQTAIPTSAEMFGMSHLTDAELLLRRQQQPFAYHHQLFCGHHHQAGYMSSQQHPCLHNLQTAGTNDPLRASLTMGIASGTSFCQMPACQSRKYSLPVQLESHATERLLHSPTTGEPLERDSSRLLFEKNNLQRFDSSSQSQGFISGSVCSSINTNTNNQAQFYQMQQYQQRLPGEVVQLSSNAQKRRISGGNVSGSNHTEPRCGRSFADNRRSSQTITRQSSFWLEDNSIDSIALSSFASGQIGQQSENSSQLDVNQLPVDATTTDQQNQSGSDQSKQRPSLGSLVLSGDSIDSVKPGPQVIDRMEETSPQQILDVSGSSPTSSIVAKQPTESTPTTYTVETNPPSAQFSQPSTSFSSPTSVTRDKLHGHLTRMRNWLSSSSSSSNTTTTTSSPSPDFSKPSERILGLAPRSSGNISKRPFGKSPRHHQQARRLPRLGSGKFPQGSGEPKRTGHQHSVPSSSKRQNDPYEDESLKAETDVTYLPRTPSTSTTSTTSDCAKQNQKNVNSGSQQSCDFEVDGEFSTVNNNRERISDRDSSSLERQCRELWRLRAALHDDSCVGDNWSNYHQRLNRRYDSGYKSIEKQLSSSLEGNISTNNTINNPSTINSNNNNNNNSNTNNPVTVNQPTVGTSPTEPSQQQQRQHSI